MSISPPPDGDRNPLDLILRYGVRILKEIGEIRELLEILIKQSATDGHMSLNETRPLKLENVTSVSWPTTEDETRACVERLYSNVLREAQIGVLVHVLLGRKPGEITAFLPLQVDSIGSQIQVIRRTLHLKHSAEIHWRFFQDMWTFYRETCQASDYPFRWTKVRLEEAVHEMYGARLTSQQLDVLPGFLVGAPPKHIARELSVMALELGGDEVSAKAVDSRLEAIQETLECESRYEIRGYVFQHIWSRSGH